MTPGSAAQKILGRKDAHYAALAIQQRAESQHSLSPVGHLSQGTAHAARIRVRSGTGICRNIAARQADRRGRLVRDVENSYLERASEQMSALDGLLGYAVTLATKQTRTKSQPILVSGRA